MHALIRKVDLAIAQIFDEYFSDFDSELFFEVEIPEGLDIIHLKAEYINVEIDGVETSVLTVVEDTAAKAKAAKDAQIALLRAQCDADIEAQQLAVYGTKNQSAALATQQSWSDIELNQAAYVPMMFPDLATLVAYIEPRMAAARMFAAWRFQRIVTRDAEITEILA